MTTLAATTTPSTPTQARRAASANPLASPDDVFYRLSVAQYHKMVAGGILNPNTPVELLEGFLVEKMPISPAHALGVKLGRRALEVLLAGTKDWHVSTESPVTTDDSEPEPDLSVLRGDPYAYATRHPVPSDVALLVEVAASTLTRDRGLKLRVYARAGVPAYWIVNLVDQVVEVHADPVATGELPNYQTVLRFAAGQAIPMVLGGRELGRVAVDDLLPRQPAG